MSYTGTRGGGRATPQILSCHVREGGVEGRTRGRVNVSRASGGCHPFLVSDYVFVLHHSLTHSFSHGPTVFV